MPSIEGKNNLIKRNTQFQCDTPTLGKDMLISFDEDITNQNKDNFSHANNSQMEESGKFPSFGQTQWSMRYEQDDP